jgi:hypothetical protein
MARPRDLLRANIQIQKLLEYIVARLATQSFLDLKLNSTQDVAGHLSMRQLPMMRLR